jgi:hypothetical protein
MLQLHSLPSDYWADARTRRVSHALLALWVLGAADLIFTIWAHRFTPFHELNPLARALLTQDALGGLCLFKITLTAFGSLIFWNLRGHTRAEAALWVMVAVYFALAIRWSNYTTDVLAMV